MGEGLAESSSRALKSSSSWGQLPLEDEHPGLLPLLKLLVRAEALELCAYLDPSSLAELACIARWRADSEQSIWCSYYVLHWGAEQGSGSKTKVRCMRSWVDDAWPAPWPLAVGFCGARSVYDHLFWVLPFLRCTLHVEKPRHKPPPPAPPTLAWQVACRVRASPGGSSRLLRCFICDTLEVSPASPEPQHFRRRWARPCPNCPRFAHRSCLESVLLSVDGAISKSETSNGASGVDRPPLRCRICGKPYFLSRRFPETLAELLKATAKEWRHVLKRVLVMLGFFIWLWTLAEHYCSLEGALSQEAFVILAFTATLMMISVSQRFHRGVQMIWNTPHRWRYFQVFGLFALLFYTVSLRAFEPSLWAATVTELPWLAGLHQVHSMIHTNQLATLILSTLSMLYLVTASGIIFLFWKTALRVPTVADLSVPSEASHSQSQCGLCQLGLCLDNTGM